MASMLLLPVLSKLSVNDTAGPLKFSKEIRERQKVLKNQAAARARAAAAAAAAAAPPPPPPPPPAAAAAAAAGPPPPRSRSTSPFVYPISPARAPAAPAAPIDETSDDLEGDSPLPVRGPKKEGQSDLWKMFQAERRAQIAKNEAIERRRNRMEEEATREIEEAREASGVVSIEEQKDAARQERARERNAGDHVQNPDGRELQSELFGEQEFYLPPQATSTHRRAKYPHWERSKDQLNSRT